MRSSHPVKHQACLAIEALEDRRLLTGVTVIVHGYQPDQSYPGWVSSMANAIALDAGGASIFKLKIGETLLGNPFVDSFALRSSSSALNGEFIIELDWSDVSNDTLTIGTAEVAALVAPKLLLAHSGAGFPSAPFAQLPIHLIGHSRGGSLVASLAEQLGRLGAWVDQLTLLDAHPVGIDYRDPLDNDPEFRVPVSQNVVFADSYYQSRSVLRGTEQLGTHDVHLSLIGGYEGLGAYEDHSDVHVWYHGTIRDDVSTNSDGGVIEDAWYSGSDAGGDARGPRSSVGYYYSRMTGGVRPVDGLSARFGGSVVRPHASTSGWEWPNIALAAPSFPPNGASHITAGTIVGVPFYYSAGKTTATVRFGTDNDRNPYNNGFAFSAATRQATAGLDYPIQNFDWTPTTADSNRYFFAQISDGTRTRYYYLNHKFVIDPAPPSDSTRPTADLSSPANGEPIAQSTINARKYIDVKFSDPAGNLDPDSITDPEREFDIPGVTVSEFPTRVLGTPATYRYSFTGNLPTGTVTINFKANTWKDSKGNFNSADSESFIVANKPIISGVTPSALAPMPNEERQRITISGSGFDGSSMLRFVSSLGNPFLRDPETYVVGSNQLHYNISVGMAQGPWTVEVINNGVPSDPFTFFVGTPVATPVISPNGGELTSAVQATISTATADATIRYTTDGSNPTNTSTVYTGPLTISSSTQLKARAFKVGMPDSAVASALFSAYVPSAPVINSVSPALLQPSQNIQQISIFGSGFLPGVLLYFYDPSGQLVQNNQTVFVSSGRLDYGLGVNAKSGIWTVKVVNDPYGNPKTSNTFSFTVAQPPLGNYPVQIAPADGATGLSGFQAVSWQPLAGAETYRVMVANSPDLPRDPNAVGLDGSIAHWISSTSQTSMVIGATGLPGKTYYWQVQATVNGVRQGWSPIWSYRMAGELNLPPVVLGGGPAAAVVTQGDNVTFTASGVSDPNSPPDRVKFVRWLIESNGIPGLQTNFPGGDSTVAVDNDGSDGWSAIATTFGMIPPYGPFTPGTHTVYTIALDNSEVISPPVVSTVTVLAANVPAPQVVALTFDPEVPTELRVQFNVDIRYAPNGWVENPFSTYRSSATYDPISRVAILHWANPLPAGENAFHISSVTNAAGVPLVGPTRFDFSWLVGDANRDRSVDELDLLIVKQNLDTGPGKGWADGDFDRNGVVDDADVQIYNANAGLSLLADPTAPNRPQNTAPLNGLVENFDRPDSTSVGNGWSDLTNNVGGTFIIKDGRLQTSAGAGEAGIYRTLPLTGPNRVTADIFQENSNRYVAQFRFANGGQRNQGYGLMFYRGDSSYANSAVILFDGTTEVASRPVTFQFGTSIHVDFTVYPDGRVEGSVSQGAQSFPFSFVARAFQNPGDNFAIINEYNSNAVPPRFDNLTVNAAGPATGVPLAPVLQSSPFTSSTVGRTHAATQWVVVRASDSAVVFNSGDDATNPTSIALPSLDYGPQYQWKARYRDSAGVWSSFSEATSFVVADPPGVVVPPGAAYSLVRSPSNATLTITAGTLTVNGDTTSDFLGLPLRVHVTGGASIILDSTLRLKELRLIGGHAAITGPKHSITLGTLTLDSTASLSLGDSSLVLADVASLTSLRPHLQFARITSSRPAVALFDNRLARVTTFEGQTLPPTAPAFSHLILTPALPGDADLDGQVTARDYAPVVASMGRTNASWLLGDLNHDGKVNSDDFALVTANLGAGAAAPAAPLLLTPPSPPQNTASPTASPTGAVKGSLKNVALRRKALPTAPLVAKAPKAVAKPAFSRTLIRPLLAPPIPTIAAAKSSRELLIGPRRPLL